MELVTLGQFIASQPQINLPVVFINFSIPLIHLQSLKLSSYLYAIFSTIYS